jgi:hypothetical protein
MLLFLYFFVLLSCLVCNGFRWYCGAWVLLFALAGCGVLCGMRWCRVPRGVAGLLWFLCSDA